VYFATVYSSNYELIFTFTNVKPRPGEIDQQAIYVLVSIAVELDAAQDG